MPEIVLKVGSHHLLEVVRTILQLTSGLPVAPDVCLVKAHVGSHVREQVADTFGERPILRGAVIRIKADGHSADLKDLAGRVADLGRRDGAVAGHMIGRARGVLLKQAGYRFLHVIDWREVNVLRRRNRIVYLMIRHPTRSTLSPDATTCRATTT